MNTQNTYTASNGFSSLRRMVIRRGLTSQQWEDVADLCEQAASGFEVGYEDHDKAARRQAAAWCRSLSMRAASKAANAASERQRGVNGDA